MNDGKIRTKMADAMMNAVVAAGASGARMSKGTRHVVRRILTSNAAGIGVKFDPSRKKVKKQAPAETAVMKEAV